MSHSCQASLSNSAMYCCLLMALIVVAAGCCGFRLKNGCKPDFMDFQLPKKKAKATCECGALFKHPTSCEGTENKAILNEAQQCPEGLLND